MNGMSDEEFIRIYGRPPVRNTGRKKKVKIYWNRIIIALIILICIIVGLVKLIGFAVGKIKGDDNKTQTAAVNTSGTQKTDSKEPDDNADDEAEAVAYSDVALIVCVDAGHGDYDGGTTSTDGLRFEKDDNLTVALKVQEYLESCGVTVVMTREDDTFLELGERCDIANDTKADFMLCLHRNSYDGDISGVEVWVHNSQPQYDTLLAQNILENLEEVGISDNRGVEYGYVGNSEINYYINSETIMPSVLVELGFLTSDVDNELFDMNVDEYSVAIGNAVIETAIELGVIDSSGQRILEEQLISEEKPINNPDDSSVSLDRTDPAITEEEVYNTQENEYAE